MLGMTRILLCSTMFALVFFSGTAAGKLQKNFYKRTCPKYDQVVKSIVQQFLAQDPTVPPGLLRMQFHDCFVRGCDASVLLSSSNSSVPAERDAIPNRSLHGFNVIDAIKAALGTNCSRVVSCADILASATLEAVSQTSGLSWDLRLGRRDGVVSLASEVNLPGPSENVTQLLNKFRAEDFSASEMVLLQAGAHSFGITHCRFVLPRLTNFSGTGKPDPTLNATFAKTLNATCRNDPNVPLDQDPVTPKLLDKVSFQNVVNHMGLFTSDQEMLFDSRTSGTIKKYFRADDSKFRKDFGRAMTKLSEVRVLTGKQGIIRTTCSLAAGSR